MIPKILHYCWFGRKPKSEMIKYCINSWKVYLPEYEIIEWNEEKFDVHKSSYVKQAYESKQWAFVSDYVRAYALYNLGGIYLDTDVEITGNLDVFLNHGAFSGFECVGYPFTALWGSEKNHYWPKKVLDLYEKLNFSTKTNTLIVSEILKEDYGINVNKDEIQEYNNDIFIYPSNYFCLNIRNYAIHHFESSWVPKELKNDVNNNLKNIYFSHQFVTNRTFYECMRILLKEFKISKFQLLKYTIKKILK
jgi:mannosyltransferase OCH1-like enzyme